MYCMSDNLVFFNKKWIEGIYCKKVFFDGEDNRVYYIVFE